MLTVKKLRKNTEVVKKSLRVRGTDFDALIDKALDIDTDWRKLLQEMEDSKAQMNRLAKKTGELFKSGEKEAAEKAKAESNELKGTVKELTVRVRELEQSLRDVLIEIPNLPHPDVPPGADDTDNETVSAHGEPVRPAGCLPHWELAEKFDLIDFKTGNKITGAGFPLYKGKGARLQRAMIQYFLNKAGDAGYTEFQPPLLVNEDSAFGTGQLPDKEGQMYQLESENLFLIPTAEVPLTNIFRDEMIRAADLPYQLTAYTPCFRREAGSHGKDVRGLNRLHQFDKVEIVQVVDPEKSWEVLEDMRNHIESLLKELGLTYRVVKLCGGDLGFASAFTYDMEVYSPGQDRWLEVSSVSNFLDFQANRMKLRVKDNDGKRFIPHTLNGSALALPRTLAALLEQNQQDNTITIPEVLRGYTGFATIEV